MRLIMSARPPLIWAVLVALVANLLLVASFGAQPAWACSTAPPPNAGERPRGADAVLSQLQKSDAVFSGVAVDVETASVSPPEIQFFPFVFGPVQKKRSLVTFDVEESWKGVFEEPVVVLDSYIFHDPCIGKWVESSQNLQEGDRYLIFAGTKYPLGIMGLSPRTGPLDNREKDLLALGAAERAFPESVAPERADTTTPTIGFGSGPAPVVVASGALLFVAAVGGLALWRWRRPG